jgi:CheY-like chemotaxis protein
MICGLLIRAGPEIPVDRVHASDSSDSSGADRIELTPGHDVSRDSKIEAQESVKFSEPVNHTSYGVAKRPLETWEQSRQDGIEPSNIPTAVTLSISESLSKSSSDVKAPKSPSSGIGPIQHARNLKILIVDDSNLTRKILHRWLKQLEVEKIEEATNGLEAVQMVLASIEQAEPFNVVLLDYVMPALTGPLAVERMRSMGYQGLVLGVTALSDTAAMDTFIAHGADRVLCKPLTIEQIANVISGTSAT